MLYNNRYIVVFGKLYDIETLKHEEANNKKLTKAVLDARKFVKRYYNNLIKLCNMFGIGYIKICKGCYYNELLVGDYFSHYDSTYRHGLKTDFSFSSNQYILFGDTIVDYVFYIPKDSMSYRDWRRTNLRQLVY